MQLAPALGGLFRMAAWRAGPVAWSFAGFFAFHLWCWPPGHCSTLHPMTFFRNLKLAHKLLASFVLVLMLSAVSGLYGLIQIDRVNNTATDLAHHWLPAARTLQDMRYQLQRYRSQTMQHVMANSTQEMAVYDKSMPKLWGELLQNHQDYAQYAQSEQERALLVDIDKDFKLYAAQTVKVVELSHKLLNDEASELLRGESLKISRGINTKLETLTDVGALMDNARPRARGDDARGMILTIGR